jgi:hypothetical protein
MECDKCGSINDDGARFCTSCGAMRGYAPPSMERTNVTIEPSAAKYLWRKKADRRSPSDHSEAVRLHGRRFTDHSQ